jgi:hypothetical protein
MGLHVFHVDVIIGACGVKKGEERTRRGITRSQPIASSLAIIHWPRRERPGTLFASKYSDGHSLCTMFKGQYILIAAKGMKHRENGDAMAGA